MIKRYTTIYDHDIYDDEKGNLVLYADHEAAMQEKDGEIANLRLYYNSTHGYESAREKIIKNLEAANADLLKKLERSNDAWIKAKEEIATLNKQHEVGFSDIILAKNAELAGLRTKLARYRDALDTIEGMATDTTHDIQGIARGALKEAENKVDAYKQLPDDFNRHKELDNEPYKEADHD